jgi:hypothetical protein
MTECGSSNPSCIAIPHYAKGCDIVGVIAAARKGQRANRNPPSKANTTSAFLLPQRMMRLTLGGQYGLTSCCRASRAETVQFLRAGARQQQPVRIGQAPWTVGLPCSGDGGGPDSGLFPLLQAEAVEIPHTLVVSTTA